MESNPITIKMPKPHLQALREEAAARPRSWHTRYRQPTYGDIIRELVAKHLEKKKKKAAAPKKKKARARR